MRFALTLFCPFGPRRSELKMRSKAACKRGGGIGPLGPDDVVAFFSHNARRRIWIAPPGAFLSTSSAPCNSATTRAMTAKAVQQR